MGNQRGRASKFQECFRNVSGGGGEPSREWAQPPPGAGGSTCSAGWGRGRRGRKALGANGVGSKRRARAWGRPGLGGGPGGRPPRAGSPPRAQVKGSSSEVPGLSLEGRGSHRRAA